MPNPFTPGPAPIPRTWFERLFGIGRPDQAKRALRNVLATHPVDALAPGAVADALAPYRVRGAAARQALLDLFRQALGAFLSDDEISHAEQLYLRALRNLFGISDRELRAIADKVLAPRFAAAAAAAVADDQLTEAERANLDRLCRRLTLDDETAARILRTAVQERMDLAVGETMANHRISPDQTAALHALAANLGARLELDAPTQAEFERMQLLWRIDNGMLPTIDVTIHLQKREVCHARVEAIWYEHRTRTVRVNYGGPVASIRICKGLRYRVGSVSVHRITHDELTAIDHGTLYLTSKRLIFDGEKRNTTIRLSSLISFTPCSDGVILEKSSGRPPTLQIAGDVELFHAMLSGALNAD